MSDQSKAAANRKAAEQQQDAAEQAADKKRRTEASMRTLEQPVEPAVLDEQAAAMHQAARSRLGQYWSVYVPDVGHDVRYYALQPEQIVALRDRLRSAGIRQLEDIVLVEGEEGYAPRRRLLAHLQRCSARLPHDKPADNAKHPPGSLLWPGDKIQAVLLQDDARLVNTARRICEFNQFFDEVPA